MRYPDTPLTGTVISRSTYNQVVRELERLPFVGTNQAIDVPRGWIFVVDVLVRKIVSLLHRDETQHPYVRISRVRCSEHSRLYVDVNSDVKAVRGVVRKYAKRCAHTCQQCGAPGKGYAFGDAQAVLCTTCAAPLLLLDDVVMTQERLSAETADAELHLTHLPAGLRVAFAEWVASREPEPPGTTVPCWHLYEWLQRIEPLAEDLHRVRKALTSHKR